VLSARKKSLRVRERQTLQESNARRALGTACGPARIAAQPPGQLHSQLHSQLRSQLRSQQHSQLRSQQRKAGFTSRRNVDSSKKNRRKSTFENIL
jgi:hypothetical protein